VNLHSFAIRAKETSLGRELDDARNALEKGLPGERSYFATISADRDKLSAAA
jgi:hypothetical protein